MKSVLLIKGKRPVPSVLTNFFSAAQTKLLTLDSFDNLAEKVQNTEAVLLFSPAWNGGAYLSGSELWLRYLLDVKPTGKLLLAGYQAFEHPNYLDMLTLGASPVNWWEDAPGVTTMPTLPALIGVDLMDKLHRFFAGHGQDSVVAVLSRIRLVVQMASRELKKMETPYSEIFTELVKPAQLAEKWGEWRSRWINYAPLFEFSPIAGKLQAITQASQQLEAWMLAEGVEEAPLRDGRILEILNFVRVELQQIENQYVVQKLSHTYR